MKQTEKGSVTMIVAVTIFFIVILLSSFFIYTTSRRRAQLEETERISNAYDGDMEEIYAKISREDNSGKEDNTSEDENTTGGDSTTQEPDLFDTSYGRIEVVWLDLENNIIDKPLPPNTEGMTPIKWEGTTEVETTEGDTEWYEYVQGNGTEDNLKSKWANAKDSKGSYFVWIPRYAYRITYYTDETSNKIGGYCDGRGIVDNNGNMKYPLDEGIKTVEKNGVSYIVHPAFMNDKVSQYSHGGWDSDLAGIWVGKYESSHSDATSSSEGISTVIKIQPNVPSWRNIYIKDCFTYSKEYNTSMESHLMKNSEWGAVVYLTHSQYGRNGKEIDINNSSSYITGNGGGSTNTNGASGITNAYNTEKGQRASSTGNIYGIYDLSGGAYEYVAAFNNASTSSYLTNNGGSFASSGGESTKYATAYQNGTSTSSGEEIYKIGKIGDATKEVNTGLYGYNWMGEPGYFFSSSYPFLLRGGYYTFGSVAGIFFSDYSNGYYNSYNSFRVVLAGN